MVGWHHQIYGQEFEQTPGDSEGQGNLACCSPYLVCVLSCFSCVQLFVTLWTVAHQALQSMGFSRQEYWSGLPCPPSGDLPNPGVEFKSLTSAGLAGGFFTTSTPGNLKLILT